MVCHDALCRKVTVHAVERRVKFNYPNFQAFGAAMKILAVILILTTAALAESFHVTAVRNIQPTDPAPVSRAFRVYVITGTIGQTRYTTQQLHSWGVQSLEVGRDYEIKKQDSRVLILNVMDKKGRPDTVRLNITSVEEVAK